VIQLLIVLVLLLPSYVWATCTVTDAYSSAVCADAPTDYYRLDESSGTAMGSIGSQAEGGTYVGGFTLGQSSVVPSSTDASVSLNGSTGYLNVPSTGAFPDATNNAGWSMEFWVNTNDATAVFYSVSDQANLKQTILIADGGAQNCDFKFFLEHCTGGDYGTITHATCTATARYYVAVTTLGGGSNTLQHARIYVNGGAPAEVTSFSGAFCQPSSPPAQWGMWAVGGINQFFYTGKVDEVAFYGVELTQAQVQNHYDAGRIPAGAAGMPFTVKRNRLPRVKPWSPREWWLLVSAKP
jgi:hypothetical protein